jgi:UPF0176 protein
MKILNIAGYKFIALNDAVHLRGHLLEQCLKLSLKGTILLSAEGININIAGKEASISLFKNLLAEDIRFDDISFHHTYSARIPFQKLKIKIKKEIITFRKPEANALNRRAPAISPAELKQWLDEEHDMTLLDTRNQYEIEIGTFTKAIHLQLSDFSELPTH